MEDPKFSDADLRYQESLRKYQVDIAKYEDDVRAYKIQVQNLPEGEVKPSRPIPPIPPMRPIKFSFTAEGTLLADGMVVGGVENAFSDFNSGVEAAALALESVGEKELAAWVRKQKRDKP